MLTQLPVIEGTLDRRILLNYRFDPEFLRRFVPAPFTIRTHKEFGVGGICMIRFKDLRPRHFPASLGIDSENAAHRIAVEWSSKEGNKEGVFIPKRDTASSFNYLAGGRVFPGIFQKSTFDVKESDGRYQLSISHEGSEPHVVFDGKESSEFSSTSIFESLAAASDFFAKGAVGYSLSKDGSHFQGMELRFLEWQIAPLKISDAHVKLYDDGKIFPKGSAVIDSAMVMKKLKHEWHNIPTIPAELVGLAKTGLALNLSL